LEPPPVFTALDQDKKQQQLTLSAKREEMITLWQSRYVFPFVSIDRNTAKWESGSQVGSVDFRLGGVPLIRLPVFVR
jgi:hypothetical protein